MNNIHTPQSSTKQTTALPNKDIDLEKYLNMFLFNWYWFVLAVMITAGTAYFINRFSIKIYPVSATLLIEDDKNNQGRQAAATSGPADIISGFGLFPSMKNLQNQLLILQSSAQIERTIRGLDFEISYYKEGFLGTQEILNESPFVVIPDKSKPQPIGITFTVKNNADSTLTVSAEQTGSTITYYNYLTAKVAQGPSSLHILKTVRYGEIIEGEGFSFMLVPYAGASKGENVKTGEYIFRFKSYNNIAKEWGNKLSLTLMQKEASIVKIAIQSECPDKAVLFLNKHLDIYMQRTLDKKNIIANNTITFIDKQLSSITDSLSRTELALQYYKSSNRVVDLSYQGQQLYEQAEKLGNRKEELSLSQNYLKYLGNYISSNREAGDLVAPSVMGIDDPLLNNLVLGLNSLTDQKVAMREESSNNPYVATINMQILNAKSTIMENTRSMMNNNNIAIQDIEKRLSEVMNEVHKLPQQERELFGIERIFKLNDNLYTYLLQQRYSAQIAKASNTPDNEIVDTAKVTAQYVSPQPMKNYAIALFLGLLIPASILLIVDYFRNRVTSDNDIKYITDLPVAGHILHNQADTGKLTLADSRSHISESFRNLRTRLQYFIKDTPSPVVLITSSMPEEGKTFTSVNLAYICSLSGKKTVIVGFDLRSSKLIGEFGLNENSRGISTYLIGRDSINEILYKSKSDNLWIIPSGPIPPNPSELASSAKTTELFIELKKMFDYIIVDSAPLGMVSDTYPLAVIADVTLLVVRYNKTIKEALKNTLTDAKATGITGMSLLLNDISSSKSLYGYSGRYYYGYGGNLKK